jgi:hypothetical protein
MNEENYRQPPKQPTVCPWRVLRPFSRNGITREMVRKYSGQEILSFSLIMEWFEVMMPGDVIELVDEDSLESLALGEVKFLRKSSLIDLPQEELDKSMAAVHNRARGAPNPTGLKAVIESLEMVYGRAISVADHVVVMGIRVFRPDEVHLYHKL